MSRTKNANGDEQGKSEVERAMAQQAKMWGAASSGWESMFISESAFPSPNNDNNGNENGNGGERKRAVVPPRWKQCLCVMLSVYIVVGPAQSAWLARSNHWRCSQSL